MDLEKRLAIIQRSTRTAIPYFVPAHNSLRMRFPWYYKWHLNRAANYVHFATLLAFVALCTLGVYTKYVPHSTATLPDNIILTDKADWDLGTKDNLAISEDPDSSLSIADVTQKTYIPIAANQITASPDAGKANVVDGDSCSAWSTVDNSSNMVIDLGQTVSNGYVEWLSEKEWGNAYGGFMYNPPAYSANGTDWSSFDVTSTRSATSDGCYHLADSFWQIGGPNTFRYLRTQTAPDLAGNPINEIKVYTQGATAIHTSATSQLDGGVDFTSWDTFTSVVAIPQYTSVTYRFRASEDALTWGNWSALTTYAASLDLSTILGETDKQKRYLQVETTLANTDGASTPTVESYTANIAEAICPAGTTESAGAVTLNTTEHWNSGTNLNTLTSNDVLEINNKAGKLDLQAMYNSDPSTVSTVMDWAVETGNKANPLDGDTSTFWGFTGPSPASTGNDDGNPFANAYWLMDLKQIYSLSQMRMYMNNDPDWPPDYSFQFAISNDGVNYSDIITTTEAQQHQMWHSFDFSVQARYVRLHIDAGGWMSFRNLAEIELYGNAVAAHTSAATQLDGTADIATWTTFTSVATVPADTALSYRFRTSDDASNWGTWSASTPYVASVDLTSLLSETDIAYRYLQVETTFSNSDGASTPTLDSYTANYIICIPDEPPAPTCDDGIKNQGEENIDCGGPCAACPADPPTCEDNILNQGEEETDCGGPCAACPADPPTCFDNAQNQGETGVDCGGPCGACPIPETCSDNIKNQDETEADCGGVCGACPEQCKYQECTQQALDDYSSCQTNALSQGTGNTTCEFEYCAASMLCFNQCGGGAEAAEKFTFIAQPNGIESYNVNDTVPVRWYYTSYDKVIRIPQDNIAVIMSISLDGGVTYGRIKALIPGANQNSPLVGQYRLGNENLPIGTYHLTDNNVMEYLWIPGNLNYVSSAVRLKLEPMLYSCVERMAEDTSDENFSITTITDPPDQPQLALEITPASQKAKPGEKVSYTLKAMLEDGRDVTSQTSFSYLTSDAAIITSSEANIAHLTVGENEGYFDRALLVTAGYDGQEAHIYGALEIVKDVAPLPPAAPSPDPPAPDPACNLWCSILNIIKFPEGILGAGSTGQEAMAMLVAAVIAAANSILNAFSLFRNVISPLIKGREKKKRNSTVYDAVTGLPITGAKVMLVAQDLESLVSVSVTDKDGRYNLQLSPGKGYLIKVEKDNYIQYLGGVNKIEEAGLPYENSYLGRPFTAGPEEYAFQRNIPILEIKTELSVIDLLRQSRVRTILMALNVSLLLLGCGIALVIFINFPTTINYIIMSLYLLILFYHSLYRFVICGQSYGEVVDVSVTRPVDLAIIRAIDTLDNRLAKTVISDVKGRYTMLLPKGKYRIFSSKEGLQQLDRVDAEVKNSFTPRHDDIRMDKAASIEEIKTEDTSPMHDMSVNSASEIIENYQKLEA